MGRKIFQQTEIKEKIDFTTGEIKESLLETTILKQAPSQDEYIKIYLDDILYLLNNKKDKNINARVLFHIYKRAEYGTQNVYLIKEIKDEIANELEVTIKAVEKVIREFVELGLLIHKGNARSCFYTLNPKYSFKGEETDRKKAIKLTVEYKLMHDGSTEN